MKKAFTLIELLAVIVILAILALIVSPIISGVISDAKKASAERSTEGYIKAVEYAQVQYQYKNKGSITQSIENLSISAQGLGKATVDSIEFNTSGIVTSATIFLNGYKCLYLKNKTKCKIPFPNETLINAFKNDKNSGLVADENEEGRYYFRGADPKNKLLLKENVSGIIKAVDYRIISFEADGTIKVVREERINTSGNAWDTTSTRNSTQDTYCTDSASKGCNAWSKQLNMYRNGTQMNTYFSLQYYANNTATEMTIQGSEDESKTTVTEDSSLNEYLNSTYLTINLAPISNYINEHMWDVGGVNPVTKDFEKDIEETKVNQWKGKIALFSVIDYVKASSNTTNCTNFKSNISQVNGNYPCSKNSDGTANNYLYKSYHQWSLSANASNRYYVWAVSSSGPFATIIPTSTFGARSSFYLKSTIKLTGDGTTDNEFKIAET